MIEKTLYQLLSELEGVFLFPVIIPQERELPAVTYLRLRTIPTNTVKGTNRKHDNGQFQIDIWAGNYLQTAELSEQIIDRMGVAYGADSLLQENKDEPYDSSPGVYHRVLIFSLREIRGEGGS